MGLSEARFGVALHRLPRDSFALQTKVGRYLVPDPKGVNGPCGRGGGASRHGVASWAVSAHCRLTTAGWLGGWVASWVGAAWLDGWLLAAGCHLSVAHCWDRPCWLCARWGGGLAGTGVGWIGGYHMGIRFDYSADALQRQYEDSLQRTGESYALWIRRQPDDDPWQRTRRRCDHASSVLRRAVVPPPASSPARIPRCPSALCSDARPHLTHAPVLPTCVGQVWAGRTRW